MSSFIIFAGSLQCLRCDSRYLSRSQVCSSTSTSSSEFIHPPCVARPSVPACANLTIDSFYCTLENIMTGGKRLSTAFTQQHAFTSMTFYVAVIWSTCFMPLAAMTFGRFCMVVILA